MPNDPGDGLEERKRKVDDSADPCDASGISTRKRRLL